MKQTFPFIAVLLLTAVVSASLIENVTIEQMTREADHVIIGTVQNKVSRWEGDQIVTDIEMVIVEVLSGNAVQRLQVTYPGGEIGEVGLSVSGITIPEIGDKLLTFVKDGDKTMSLLYGNHGQFLIDGDAAYRAGILVGDSSGKPEAFNLEDLKNRIRKAM